MPVYRLDTLLGCTGSLWYLITKVYLEFGILMGICTFIVALLISSKLSSIVLKNMMASKIKVNSHGDF